MPDNTVYMEITRVLRVFARGGVLARYNPKPSPHEKLTVSSYHWCHCITGCHKRLLSIA